MSDQQVDDFLEHFGIKGMRWGVKNQTQLDRVNRVSRGTEIRKFAQEHKKAIATGATIAVGAAFTAVLLSNKGRRTIRSIVTPTSMFPRSAPKLETLLRR